jgi:DNA helicase-2/ATP-dependent DNA helicase PcrA
MEMTLSPQQQAAVDYLGTPTLVVAGAGSGKTRTLTAKVARLIEQGYDPARILAITFTNKAAEEMKRRLQEITGLDRSAFPWVRTYHSACYRILREHCERLGYTRPIQIFGTYQQGRLIREVLFDLNIDKKQAATVAAQISNAKNSGDPDRYFDSRPRIGRIRLVEPYRRYEALLKQKNAVDFDNILTLTRNLLRDHPDIRDRYREQFQFILCDEYQDTNDLNEQITAYLLGNGNLFVVGDDWQSIYSFRMSNVDHFLSFRKTYPDGRVFRLEQNFRSVDEIVQLANGLIDHNNRKMDKRCFSDRRGGTVEIHDFYSDRDEADWVAGRIQKLRRTGIPLREMAILYRTKFVSLTFEQALRAAGIDYRMLGGRGFFERKEILDLHCYLTAAIFPKDDAAFERALGTPKRGIGPTTLKKIAGLRTGEMSLQDAGRQALREKILTPKVYDGLSRVIDLLDDIRDLAPAEAIHQVLDRTGYIDHLKQYVKAASMEFTVREENIEQLIYSASPHETIHDYLEEAALVREDRDEDEEGGPSDAVNLSTVHSAKGLEFTVVFVVGCEENLFPHWRSVETPSGLEEERRLMYVSVTRSGRYLYLSHAGFRKGNANRRSRFIDEIEDALDE